MEDQAIKMPRVPVLEDPSSPMFRKNGTGIFTLKIPKIMNNTKFGGSFRDSNCQNRRNISTVHGDHDQTPS